MKNYLVKTKTSEEIFYVQYDEKLQYYISVIGNKIYHKDDIIIIREL